MRQVRQAAAAVVVVASLLILAAAPSRAAGAPVSVSLYWPSGAPQAQQALVPVGATVKVMLEYGSDGGYDAEVVAAPDAAVFATSGPETFHTKLPPGAAGGYGYALWTFTAIAPGTTTFAVDEARSWDHSDAVAHLLTLVARDGEAVPLGDAACPAGTSVVGMAVGGHVGIRLTSNASTGYTWTEVAVPNTVAFRPDDPQGTYTAPAADAPPGAAGYQTFGYTGLADGSSPVDLAYARAGEAPATTCRPTVVVGVAADPHPDGEIVPIETPAPVSTDEPELTAPPATPPVTATPTSGADPADPAPSLAIAGLGAIGGLAAAAALVLRPRRARARIHREG